jgi:hypothetical protein
VTEAELIDNYKAHREEKECCKEMGCKDILNVSRVTVDSAMCFWR